MSTIKCEVQTKRNGLYITHTAQVFPCCHLGSTILNVPDKIEAWLKISNNNLYDNSLKDIVEGDFFDIIQESFDINSDDPFGACETCVKVCGKADKDLREIYEN